MTETLARPQRRAAATPDPVPSLVPVAALGAAAAAALGLLTVTVLVLLTWVSASGAGSTGVEATRAAAAGWLLAHKVPLALPAGTLALPPLGLTLLPVGLLVRWGGWVARTAHVTTPARALQAGLALAASYSVLLGLVAGAAAGAVVPSAIGALVAGWLIAALAGGVGVIRGAGLTTRALSWLPEQVRGVAVAGLAGALGVLAAGAVVSGIALAAHGDRALHLVRALDAGVAGTVALGLLGVAYVPTAAIWGSAYSLGPGFAVGAGTSVGPFATHLGAVPALPLLAGLPGDGTGVTAGALALALPFVAGAVAGVVLVRRADFDTPEHAALWGALIGPAAGLLLAVVCWVATGPAGPGRLGEVGPSPWQVGLAAAVELAIAGAAGAWETRRRLG